MNVRTYSIFPGEKCGADHRLIGGLGAGHCRGLAEAGAAVILNGRDEAKLTAAAHSWAIAGHRVTTSAFDVSNESAIEAAFEVRPLRRWCRPGYLKPAKLPVKDARVLGWGHLFPAA